MRRGFIVGGFAMAFASACEAPYVQKPFYFVDFHGHPPIERIVQQERPETCPESTQPTLIDFEGPRRVPVWACLAACKPDHEPVTYAMVLPNANESTQLSARCEPICNANKHRESYFMLGHEGEQHCADGAPRPALDAEQERLRSVHDAREGQAFMAIEEQIAQLSGRAAPWDASALQAYGQIDTAIRLFDDAWEDRASTIRLRAELARFEGLHRVAADDSSTRHRFEKRVQRAEGNCNYTHRACRATCTKVPSACDQCESDFATCETAAKKGT
jgi:hypothetical protein